MGGYRFGEFEIDLDLFMLKRGVHALPMQPKIFDVLRYLVERRGTVVTKAELLHEIWRDEDVYDNVVAWSVSHIRRALGQRGGRHPIETVSRGYRFTAEVTEGDSGARESHGAPSSRPTPLPPLVGRAQVMAELIQQVEAAFHGRGSLCVVTGEAGIGKTRCVEELAAAARGLGVQVLWGRCPQDLAVPTLWPIASALASLAREQPELVARARKLVADPTAEAATAGSGTALALHGGAPSPGAPGDSRFWLIERGADVLRDLAGKAGTGHATLLILDDLHWADAGTLDLLGFVAPELRDIPLCVVATLRDGELQPGSEREQPLRRVLRHARAIPLGAFDAVEVAELAQQIGQHRPSDALAEAMRVSAGGIPLFVHEIVRSLLRQHGEQGLASLSPETIKLPALARDLLHERIQRLPEPTRELLSSAAVIGDSFDLSLLMAMVELEPEVLLERLDPALAEGQLRSDAPHTYRFAHSLFQSVLYDDVLPGQRATRHRKLGTLLLARTEPERHYAEAARHLYLALPAVDPQLVMQVARKAGDAAQRGFAHENAVIHYSRALEAQLFAGNVDSALRAELLLALGTAQRMAGRTRDALETSSRVLELAQQQRMGDIVVRATRLRRPTVAMSMIPDALARAALEAVLEHLPDEASATRVSALSQLAFIPPYSGNLARSKQLSARALELASELPDRESEFEALRARLFSLSGPDDIDEVSQVAERMLRAAADQPATFHGGDAMTARYTAHILAGRIAEADAVLQQMTAAISGRHWPEASFYCERLALQRRFLDGYFEQADEGWKALHARAMRAGVSYADMFFGAHIFNLTLEREGPAIIVASSRGGGSLTGMTLYTRAAYARHTAEAGEHEAARGQLATLGDPHGFPRDGHYLHLLANLAACASRVDDKPRCEQLFALLAPYAQLNTPSQMGYYMGSVAYFLGLLAAALGRETVADEYFARARARNQAMGYRAGVTRTLLAHGQLAARMSKPEVARELLNAACEQARALGMNALLQDAEKSLTLI